MKSLHALHLCLLLLMPLVRVDPPPAPQAKDASTVDGLALSATLKGAPLKSGDTVPPCRQVIVSAKLTAEKGEVRWLLFGSGVDLDFETSGNSVALVTLPDGGRVDVFAIATNDGKLTEFASFVILSKSVGPAPPGPGPNPPPAPGPVKPVVGRLHVSLIEDAQTRTPELAAIIASQTFRAAMGQAAFRVFDWRDPSLAKSRINATAAGVTLVNAANQPVGQSTLPALLVTDDAGTVHLARAMPKTEAEVLTLLKPYLGGK